MDEEDDFYRLLQDYLEPDDDPNPEFLDAAFEWIEGRPEVGVDHFHDVTKEEVWQAIMRIPPDVEVKRDAQRPNRLLFYGATRADRWIFVVCDERIQDGRRILTPITAFEPDDGRAYWEAL